MSIELLEEAAAALGEIRDDVMFLGAATLSLWITDEAAPPLRPTADVDVVVEVTTFIEYNQFEARLAHAPSGKASSFVYGRDGRARAEEWVIPRLERIATSGS